MKAQLETARLLVRALFAMRAASYWATTGVARRVRDCTVCVGHQSGRVPPQGLLVGLDPVPVAAGLLVVFAMGRLARCRR